jgi:tRNA dimethylallyltransferase
MHPDALHFLVGPTASGKSELALAVAERAGAEIVSLDSMLVYRGMDIGTAKPGRDARARVAHHALDLVEPSQTFTVQDYLAAARTALDSIAGRGKRALFVGGTAFYLKTLTHGLFEGPEVDPALRASLEARIAERGRDAVHAELAALDPRSAARIHPNDVKRVVRALEVWHQTGRTLSAWQNEWGWHAEASEPDKSSAHRIVGLAVPTPVLDARIRARTTTMLDAGWVDEARAVRADPGFGATAAQALGYAEVLRLADGELDRGQAELAIATRTRQFARRQRTWLRKFPALAWIETGAARGPDKARDPADLVGEVSALLGW